MNQPFLISFLISFLINFNLISQMKDPMTQRPTDSDLLPPNGSFGFIFYHFVSITLYLYTEKNNIIS